METFQIHEDCEATNKENVAEENKSKIPQRKRAGEKRTALRSHNNGVKQDKKRKKIETKRSGIVQKQHNVPKEDKTKPETDTDTDLLKIVPDESVSCQTQTVAKLCFSKESEFSTEYSESILKYYQDMEQTHLPKKNYMDRQPQLTWAMRAILVDWLVCVANEYTMSNEVLYLAVNYIDRFLSKISVVCEKLQLLGASAMMIAGKLEEVYPPMPDEWVFLTKDTYSVRQIVKMEMLITKVLEFKLQPPTPYTFVEKFCLEHGIDDATRNLALYLSELALLEGRDYLNFKPSEIAAASILYARYNLLKSVVWPKEMEKVSGYTAKHLSPIVQAQSVTLKDSPNKPQQAIQEKYRSPKYSRVALVKPRSVRLNFFSEPSVEKGECSGSASKSSVAEAASGNSSDSQ